MRLVLHPVDLKLRHPFRIAHGETRVQRNLVVELIDGPCRGYGETAEVGYYPGATRNRIVDILQAARAAIESARWEEPAEFREQMRPHLQGNLFAACALDQAAHDLWGRRHEKPVWKLWGLHTDRLPPTDYTIGIDTIEIMLAKMREFAEWPIYKIKLGTPDDLEIIRRLRGETGATFRVDANTGWTVEQTLRNARELESLGVEFIEQPLPPEDWEGMKRLHEESPLPLAADESCLAEQDVERCAGCFQIVNIKLTKCGGLTPARRMIAAARRLGLQVMIGCMTESSVGISAAAQLLPLVDYADLDGALLIADDPAEGVRFERGRPAFPDRPGCGLRWLGPDSATAPV